MDAYLPAYLKNKNRTRVMSLFFENKELTRPEIAKMTGISMPTVIKITDFLLGKNLIQENPEKIPRILLPLLCETMPDKTTYSYVIPPFQADDKRQLIFYISWPASGRLSGQNLLTR